MRQDWYGGKQRSQSVVGKTPALRKLKTLQEGHIADQSLRANVGDCTAACEIQMLQVARWHNWSFRQNVDFLVNALDESSKGVVIQTVAVHQD
jgi:hypothetical protein